MDILELARKTGKTKWFGTHPDGTNDFLGVEFSLEQLKHFYHAAYAAGVAAEKARCAALCSEVAAGKDAEAIEEAILARELNSFEDDRKKADKQNELFDDLEKLRDESHKIVGASDDYKQGREMGIQLCINELTRVKDD